MPDLRLFASTSNLIRFSLKNSSTGAPLTGLTGSSSGLIIGTIADVESATTVYTQAASHIQTIATLGTYAAPSASNCRFGEVDATNHPGLYEFQFADARFAVSNAKRFVISVSGAASLLATDYEIELVQFNPFDAVHLGLSALPNTAVTTNASLITSGTGTDQLQVTSGLASANAKQINAVATTSVTTVSANVGTTQPLNFTGTAGSALVKGDTVDIAGSAVSASTAQLGVNVVNIGGSASTGAAGYVGIDWGHVNAPTTTVGLSGTTVGTVTTVTNQLTAAQIATGIWQDATAGDFTTANSIGKSLYNSFTSNTSVFTVAALANAPTGGSAPTVGQIATAVWQDTTAGDFTTAGSIGKSLFTSGNVPGAASGIAIVGSAMGAGSIAANAITSGCFNLLAGLSIQNTANGLNNAVNFAPTDGNGMEILAGSGNHNGLKVTSSGTAPALNVLALGTGNGMEITPDSGDGLVITGDITSDGMVNDITGNLSGSVGSVTARVTANTDQIAGDATAATNQKLAALAIVIGVVGTGSTTTSIVTSSLLPAAVDLDQFKGRVVLFTRSTTTTGLRAQGTDITGSSTGGVLTVTALTEAPVAGDTFIVV